MMCFIQLTKRMSTSEILKELDFVGRKIKTRPWTTIFRIGCVFNQFADDETKGVSVKTIIAAAGVRGNVV